MAERICRPQDTTGRIRGVPGNHDCPARHLLTTVSEFPAEWLGLKDRSGGEIAAKATEKRAEHIAVVLALAACEASITRDTWRTDGTSHYSSHGDYLRFIESCGYTLSDVEKYAASKNTA